MSHANLTTLEQKLEQLIDAYQNLEQENVVLRSERENWHTERLRLMQQNQMARSKVEAMIERLKSMEADE